VTFVLPPPSPVPPPPCLSLSDPMHYLLDQVWDGPQPVSETVPFVPLLPWLCFPPLCFPLEPNAHFTRPSRLGSRSLPCCLSGLVNDETFSSMYSRLSLELDEGRLPIGLCGVPERYIRFKIFDRNSSSEGSCEPDALNNTRGNKSRGFSRT